MGLGRPFLGNEKTRYGTLHEPLALRHYEALTGISTQPHTFQAYFAEDCYGW